MFAVDDGLWVGNLNAADWLFLIAAIVFGLAAVLPHTHRGRTEGVRFDLGISLVPLGLCLVSIAWLVL
jgi:hypothetical protein